MKKAGLSGKWLGGRRGDGHIPLQTPVNPRQAHNRTKVVLGWVESLTSPKDHYTQSPLQLVPNMYLEKGLKWRWLRCTRGQV